LKEKERVMEKGSKFKVDSFGYSYFWGCGVIGSAVVSTGRGSIPLGSTNPKGERLL